MRKILLLIMLCILFKPALALEANQEMLCRLLPEYRPVAADGAEYRPGIDVHGNPVTAADLGAPLNPITQLVVIPVEVDLVQRFNLLLPKGVELKPTVATLRIHSNGRVEYNGQDVSAQAYHLCGKAQEHALEIPQSETTPQGNIIEGQYP